MQQENNQTNLQELDVLESFVRLGGNLPYGPYLLFTKLAHRYPLHFIRFMSKHHRAIAQGAETLHRQLLLARDRVEVLSQKLEHHLQHEPRTEEERQEFREAVEGLENLMWLRTFNDPSYTHFLDIDQFTDDEEGLGIQSLFYRVEDVTLHIHLTDQEGKKLGSASYPFHGGSVQEALAAFLLTYFSEPGSHSGDNQYVWSNLVSRKAFEALSRQGLAVKQQKREAAEGRATDNALIQYCAQHGLAPRPYGGSDTSWTARCPSGGAHTLMISTASNQWGCGYCCKKGGLEELAQWVASRPRSRR